MLHRLLTLPSQLLEGDEESMEAPPIFLEAPTDSSETALAATSPRLASPPALMAEEEEEEEEEEVVAAEEEDEEEEEDKSSDTDHGFSPRGARSSGKKMHVCKQCGKRFSRAHLLKAHRQTHETGSAVRCPECGKRFTHPSRLQAHLRTHREHHVRSRREPQE